MLLQRLILHCHKGHGAWSRVLYYQSTDRIKEMDGLQSIRLRIDKDGGKANWQWMHIQICVIQIPLGYAHRLHKFKYL